MIVQPLVSNFFGKITFPHYTKVIDKIQTFSAGVVFQKEIGVGDMVSLTPLIKNARVFQVTEIGEKRKARGDWSFTDHPDFCEIKGDLVGFYDQTNNRISSTFLN